MFALIRALPLLWQIGIGAAAIAAPLAAWYGVKTHYYNQGWHAALEGVAADDKEAVHAANGARSRVRACRDADGLWDTTRGQCLGR